MNQIWTSKAEYQYSTIITDLITNWGNVIAQNFINDVDTVLIRIVQNPNLFRISKSRLYLRKAKISKHNYLIYQIDQNDLIILSIGYSRSKKSTLD